MTDGAIILCAALYVAGALGAISYFADYRQGASPAWKITGAILWPLVMFGRVVYRMLKMVDKRERI